MILHSAFLPCQPCWLVRGCFSQEGFSHSKPFSTCPELAYQAVLFGKPSGVQVAVTSQAPRPFLSSERTSCSFLLSGDLDHPSVTAFFSLLTSVSTFWPTYLSISSLQKVSQTKVFSRELSNPIKVVVWWACGPDPYKPALLHGSLATLVCSLFCG